MHGENVVVLTWNVLSSSISGALIQKFLEVTRSYARLFNLVFSITLADSLVQKYSEHNLNLKVI